MNTLRCALLLITISAAPVHAASINLFGLGQPQADGSVLLPPVEDLAAFRAYFAEVLRGYERYAPFADELAAGVEAVGPLTLKPRTIEEMEQGFGGDLDVSNVGFNPLATGGTQDIATGGDYIDRELGSDRHNFEVANVDIEKNVFKQEFGPVQGKRLASPPPGGDQGLDWYAFEFLGVDATKPFPEPAFFASNLTTRLSVVPEPSALMLAAIACLGWRKRRG